MEKSILKKAFYNYLKLGKKALREHRFSKAFYYFENAHILGQKHLYRHTVSHI